MQSPRCWSVMMSRILGRASEQSGLSIGGAISFSDLRDLGQMQRHRLNVVVSARSADRLLSAFDVHTGALTGEAVRTRFG